MSIDIFNDELISLSQAARSLPNYPSQPTVWRWHKKGVGGAKLETVVIGGRRYTTRDAFRQFVQQTTTAVDYHSCVDEPSKERSDRTKHRLEKAGLLWEFKKNDGRSNLNVLPAG